MADELDAATETLVITPEIWSQQMVDYVYSSPVMMNRVHRVDREIVAMGSKINLPQMPALTVGDVTATTGAVANQSATYTEIELTIDKWRYNAVTLVNKAGIQANRDILADFRRAYPDALMADVDAKLMALHGDITTYTQGDANTQPNEDLMTATVADLLGANLGNRMRDPNQVTFFLHTNLWKYLKKIAGWVDACVTGEAVGGRQKLELPNLYGIPVLLSSQIVSSSGRRNFLCLKEVFALGIQKGIDIQEIPIDALAKKIAASVLYGVKAYNEARGVKITTVAA